MVAWRPPPLPLAAPATEVAGLEPALAPKVALSRPSLAISPVTSPPLPEGPPVPPAPPVEPAPPVTPRAGGEDRVAEDDGSGEFRVEQIPPFSSIAGAVARIRAAFSTAAGGQRGLPIDPCLRDDGDRIEGAAIAAVAAGPTATTVAADD